MRAVACVATLVLLVALTNPMASFLGASPADGAAAAAPSLSGGALVQRFMREGDAASLEELLEGGRPLSSADREPPDWFSEEVLDLTAKRAVTATADWSVVGFEETGHVDAVLGEIADELKGRGWALVESGVPGAVSGVKERGVCQWLWLGCTAIGEEVVVVVQVTAGL